MTRYYRVYRPAYDTYQRFATIKQAKAFCYRIGYQSTNVINIMTDNKCIGYYDYSFDDRKWHIKEY